MQDFEKIRNRFIELQTSLNLSDKALGEYCGVSHTAINNIRNGKSKGFDVSILAQLHDKLGINPSWLIVGDGDPGINIARDSSVKYGKKHIINLQGNQAFDNNISGSLIQNKSQAESMLQLEKCNTDLQNALNEIKHLQSKLQDKEEIIQLLKDKSRRA